MREPEGLAAIVAAVRACRICRDAPRFGPPLAHEPRPVVRLSATARLLIAGQAPGVRVHLSGVPFDDPSGDRLRAWMGVDKATFYDESRIAIIPMGLCFPGHDAHKGDLPPRRECRLEWHDRIFDQLPQIETILAIGTYAQTYHFARAGRPLRAGARLGDIVRDWRSHAGDKPKIFALPHPSWRNSGWLKRNPWFETDVLPAVRAEVKRLTER
jgi:uracil-DNA glycosylase